MKQFFNLNSCCLKNIFTNRKNHKILQINPQGTIPTLVEEDGFTVWESHAINAYLVNKYGKDDSLYPKDYRIRAVVDQRLHFDTGVLFPRMAYIVVSYNQCNPHILDENSLSLFRENNFFKISTKYFYTTRISSHCNFIKLQNLKNVFIPKQL